MDWLDGGEDLLTASVAKARNCFIKSKQLITTASGWLERLDDM